MSHSGLEILLVDDNASIRELLSAALSPLAAVEAFPDAYQALRRAERRPQDLVLCDYRMPGLSGLELLSALVSSVPSAGVIMLASRADIAGPLASSNSLVEEFIEKPFFVDDAVARIQRVLNRICLAKSAHSSQASSSSFRGTLAQMSVLDLMQTVDLGRKSCLLAISHQELRCEMFFQDGQIVHARFGEMEGEEAVCAVVGWAEGSFQIDFERFDSPRSISRSTQSVLMEALRRLDESRRDEAVPKHPPQPGLESGLRSASAS